MRISSKGRYALASLIDMAQNAAQSENVTVIALSQRLDISKIYLEQVFSLIRKSGLVNSIKGAQGGYQLARPASQITAYDILSATELSLFAQVDGTVEESAPGIEKTMNEMVFTPVADAIEAALRKVTLLELAETAQYESTSDGYMYYL